MKRMVRVTDVYDLPYQPEPSMGIRHVDLRQNPREIDTIPELRGEAVLKSLIALLNHPDGMFMTHGCAFALEKPYGVAMPVSDGAATASHWCASYVTVSFWRLSQNKEEEYEALYEKFASDQYDVEICFVVQPTYFLTAYERNVGAKWSERNGTVCLIWASGWGNSAAMAHSRWRNAVKGLISFFSTFDRQTDSAATTVSQHMSQESKFPKMIPARIAST